MKGYRLVDLSVSIVDNPPGSFIQSKITYVTHEESARIRGEALQVPKDVFPEGRFAAEEILVVSTHAGTHMDAPWHYGPFSEGKPAKTIDQIPLEWCYADGVVLDFTNKKAGDVILKEDVEAALQKINYDLKPFDIVLIRTDASKNYGKPGYERMHPGMGKDATLYLIERGVKVMGIDAWGWDPPFKLGDIKNGRIWEAHYVGKEKEYCHLENLANLDLLPPYGFKLMVFPVKIYKASAGWVRAVAILGD